MTKTFLTYWHAMIRILNTFWQNETAYSKYCHSLTFDFKFLIFMPYQQTAPHISNIEFDHRKYSAYCNATHTYIENNSMYCIFRDRYILGLKWWVWKSIRKKRIENNYWPLNWACDLSQRGYSDGFNDPLTHLVTQFDMKG